VSDNVGTPLANAVDVHAHFLTPRLRQALLAAGHDGPDGMPTLPEWSPEDALNLMDRTGIAVAMLSISSPGVLLGDARQTRLTSIARCPSRS
jgi:hypothetical protein